MNYKLIYKNAAGNGKTYEREFVSVREAVYVAANTGYLLEANELHITPVKAKAPDVGGKDAA